jgi:hypothetical protein
VFLSSDSGTSWTAIDSGLPSATGVNALALCGTNLFAGTSGRSVWRMPLEVTSVGKRRTAFPPDLSLKLRCRRGTSTSLSIAFSLPYAGQVTLDIYDLSGNRISTLVNKYLGEGRHSLPWVTQSVAPGWYVMRLHSGMGTVVKRVEVLR